MKTTIEKAKKLVKRIGIPTIALILVALIGIPMTAYAISNQPAKPTDVQQQKTEKNADENFAFAISADTTKEHSGDDVMEEEKADDPSDEHEEEEEASFDDEANDDAALAGKATLTVAQANDIALAANPGATIVKTKLGDENGTIIYEVLIKTADGKIAEIKVNVTNGGILPEDNDHED